MDVDPPATETRKVPGDASNPLGVPDEVSGFSSHLVILTTNRHAQLKFRKEKKGVSTSPVL